MFDEKGLYLKLFHGRPSLGMDMDDWGQQGPIFGPCEYVHTTYGDNLKLGNNWPELRVVDDCVYYNGMYYGDWSVCLGENLSIESREQIEQPNAGLANPEHHPCSMCPLVGGRHVPTEI